MPHVFDMLGTSGPYRLTRVTVEGGCCEFCGTAIKYRFYLKGQGSEFFVGSDCVMRSGDNSLIPIVREEVARRVREARAERLRRGVEGVVAKLRDAITRAELATRPHPNTYFASQGKTFVDYLEFCVRNAGRTKLANLDRQAEEMLAV